MKKYFNSSLGFLRLLAFLEGISLLLLVFVAMPLKHVFGQGFMSSVVGQVHGVLFLLFIFNTLKVGIEQHWHFRSVTWKVLLACVIPFGTFYIDRHILRKFHTSHP